MKKAAVWCEVSCGDCGRAEGMFYKNSKSIQTLKEWTRDWVFDDDFGNICPDCARKKKKGLRLN